MGWNLGAKGSGLGLDRGSLVRELPNLCKKNSAVNPPSRGDTLVLSPNIHDRGNPFVLFETYNPKQIAIFVESKSYR